MRSLKIIFLCLFALGCALLCSRCTDKNKEKDPQTIVYTLGEVKDYFYFKKGTYWVYQNDYTGEIDSQWVRGSRISWSTQKGREEHSKHLTLEQETLWVDVYSNFTDGLQNQARWEYYTNGNVADAFPFPKRVYPIEKTKYERGSNSAATRYGLVGFIPFDRCTTNDCSCKYDSLLTNYSLNGHVYDTVRVFKIAADDVTQETKFIKFDGPSWYYYAKNVGIIKIYSNSYRVFDNKPYKASWNLIRYKIVQ